jgi:hypothetical protein
VQPERDVRVKRAQRGQITWGRVDLDAEVPADYEVRAIAASSTTGACPGRQRRRRRRGVIDKLDLRGLYASARRPPRR